MRWSRSGFHARSSRRMPRIGQQTADSFRVSRSRSSSGSLGLLVAIRRASSRVKSCLAHFQSESPHPSGHGSRMHSSVLRWPAARTDCICFRQSLYGSQIYSKCSISHHPGSAPDRHHKANFPDAGISDHLWGDLYHQSVSVDRVLVFQRSCQNRPIVIGHSHRTGFDLRLATKRAPANAQQPVAGHHSAQFSAAECR